jgi:serine/threonine-protein kinase RsbW
VRVPSLRVPPSQAHTLTFRATAEPASLARLRAELSAFLAEAGAPEELRSDVMLAVSEAANNVLIHAYRHRATPGAMVVAVRAGGGAIRVVVTDEGSGLAPRPDSPGAGLGLPMMAQLTDELDVRRQAGGGTSVALTWRHSA